MADRSGSWLESGTQRWPASVRPAGPASARCSLSKQPTRRTPCAKRKQRTPGTGAPKLGAGGQSDQQDQQTAAGVGVGGGRPQAGAEQEQRARAPGLAEALPLQQTHPHPVGAGTGGPGRREIGPDRKPPRNLRKSRGTGALRVCLMESGLGGPARTGWPSGEVEGGCGWP